MSNDHLCCPSCKYLDMNPKIACDDDDNDDYADDVKDAHYPYPGCSFLKKLNSLLDNFPQAILHAANGILDLAGGLLGLAVRLQLGVADCLADGFLDRAFDLVGSSRDPILIHD
jgi:hypothetical protein